MTCNKINLIALSIMDKESVLEEWAYGYKRQTVKNAYDELRYYAYLTGANLWTKYSSLLYSLRAL